MFIRRNKNGVIYYTSPLFDRLKITHMFATRFGGISEGFFCSLNVSTARKDNKGKTDSPENVEENYRRALAVLGTTPEKCCGTKQVHGDNIIVAEGSLAGRGILAKFPEMPECDGIIAKNDGDIDGICVKTADCVPILMKNIKTGDICAVHAGWRGTVSDIVTKAAEKLSGTNSENIVAAIGPCIGRCCYQVGSEVYSRFETLFKHKDKNYDMSMLFSALSSPAVCTSTYLDLSKANSELLRLAGIKPENIDVSGICTCCYAEESVHPFFSHRASGGFSGTFVSAITR